MRLPAGTALAGSQGQGQGKGEDKFRKANGDDLKPT
jgi:hypothetical protein